jgi:hypothetical protein
VHISGDLFERVNRARLGSKTQDTTIVKLSLFNHDSLNEMLPTKRTITLDSESEFFGNFPNKVLKLSNHVDLDVELDSPENIFDRVKALKEQLARRNSHIRDLEAQILQKDWRINALGKENIKLGGRKSMQNMANSKLGDTSSRSYSLLIMPGANVPIQRKREVNFTRTLADNIHEAIDEAHSNIHFDPSGCWPAQSSDKASRAMVSYISEIDKLSKIEGGLELAFDLILHLGKKSIKITKSGCVCTSGKRKSDGPADDLLLYLTKKMKQTKKDFVPLSEFEELNRQRKLFSLFDPESTHDTRTKGLFVHNDPGDHPFSDYDTFFPKSYELMWSYIVGPEGVQRHQRELKTRIHDTHTKIEEEVKGWNQKGGFEYASYKLSRDMQPFVQSIRRLGYMEGGLRDAFDLVLYLGRWSCAQLSSIFGGYNLRPLDPLADGLLVELAKLIKEEDPNFDPTDVLTRLKEEVDSMEYHGIYTYFPRSCKWLSSWEAGAKMREKAEKARIAALDPKTREMITYRDKLGQRVGIWARKVTKQLEDVLPTLRRPTSDWVSQKIIKEDFITDMSV